MFFLFSIIWAIVVVQSNPPAVGEAATPDLAQSYINIVTSPEKLSWTSYAGPDAEGHNIKRIAEVVGIGKVYETLLKDGTRRITLLVGAYLDNVAAGLTYFRDLYNKTFNSSPSGTAPNPLHLTVVEGTRKEAYPPLTDKGKAELKAEKKVEVVKSTFGEILKAGDPNHVYIILNFANTELVVRGGQDIEMAEEFPSLQKEYYQIMQSRNNIKMGNHETAIVYIPPENNTAKRTCYVLPCAAPKSDDLLVWAKTVHSVLLATQQVIDITDDRKVTVIYGAHGCGIFGGKGEQVAPLYFSGLFDSGLHHNPKVTKIYFTAFADKHENYTKFCEALGQVKPAL